MIEVDGDPPVIRWEGKVRAFLRCGHFCAGDGLPDAKSRCCECRRRRPARPCALGWPAKER